MPKRKVLLVVEGMKQEVLLILLLIAVEALGRHLRRADESALFFFIRIDGRNTLWQIMQVEAKRGLDAHGQQLFRR